MHADGGGSGRGRDVVFGAGVDRRKSGQAPSLLRLVGIERVDFKVLHRRGGNCPRRGQWGVTMATSDCTEKTLFGAFSPCPAAC